MVLGQKTTSQTTRGQNNRGQNSIVSKNHRERKTDRNRDIPRNKTRLASTLKQKEFLVM